MKLKQKVEKALETSRPKGIELSENMIDLLIKQVSHELHNYTLYKTFANYFGACGLNLLREYYLGRADEELLHHQWIADYLDERGVFFKYPAIAEVNEEFNEHIDVFKLTVTVEEDTTKLIYDIVNLAYDEKDWLTISWLTKNTGSKLLLEQAEEESISNMALEIAEQDGSWFEKERAILSAYKS